MASLRYPDDGEREDSWQRTGGDWATCQLVDCGRDEEPLAAKEDRKKQI